MTENEFITPVPDEINKPEPVQWEKVKEELILLLTCFLIAKSIFHIDDENWRRLERHCRHSSREIHEEIYEFEQAMVEP